MIEKVYGKGRLDPIAELPSCQSCAALRRENERLKGLLMKQDAIVSAYLSCREEKNDRTERTDGDGGEGKSTPRTK